MNETCNVTTTFRFLLHFFGRDEYHPFDEPYRHKVYRFTLCPDGRIATGK